MRLLTGILIETMTILSTTMIISYSACSSWLPRATNGMIMIMATKTDGDKAGSNDWHVNDEQRGSV